MADKTKVKSKGGDGSKAKENKRWIFDDDMTASLVESLKNYKADKEDKGIDFEGDLVKLYGDIREVMAAKYDETNFGPVQLHASETDVNDMSKEDYKAFKEKFDKEQKLIKLGYERIKAKIKKIRASFQKAVLEGTRSGSGKVIKEHWDALIQIWGGAPGTVPLEYGESSLNGFQPEVEDEASQLERIHGVEPTIHDNIIDESEEENDTSKKPKKRKCPTALYVDEKRKKLEKSLSCKQRDNVMLQIMKEDLALKKKSMTTDESNKSADANAMVKIADSMQMLSHAIMTGFNHLVAVNQSNQQPFPQQPFPQQYQVLTNSNLVT